MNKAYDYNGTVVSTSKPVRELRTVKKTLLIDSGDRDATKYYTNGDVVYYLPRVYENVVCIRLKSATFTPVVNQEVSPTTVAFMKHNYSDGANIQTATWMNDVDGPVSKYILLDIEGLNKCDELAFDSQKSTFVDSFFARIPCEYATSSSSEVMISYNDHTHEENISYYTPAIRKLDRMHIVTRIHKQQGAEKGFIYSTSDGSEADGAAPEGSNVKGAEYSLVFEITMLENSFDDFSSFETRLSTRTDTSNSFGHFGC